jgi:hypothetical protein
LGDETTRKIKPFQKRKLTFEFLENRELLSADIFDNSYLDDNMLSRIAATKFIFGFAAQIYNSDIGQQL